MNKVYVIRYEESYSDGSYASGVSYCYKELEEAEKMLNSIKLDECDSYVNNGWDEDEVKERTHNLITKNGFVIDFYDGYTKWVIEEMDVK